MNSSPANLAAVRSVRRIVIDEAVAVYSEDSVAGEAPHLARLLVRGWALAEDLIVNLTLVSAGVEFATINLGADRPDVAALFPLAEQAAQSGFMLMLEDVDAGSVDLDKLALVAKTASGARFFKPVTVTRVRQPERAAVEPIRISTDRALVTAQGILTIEGWAASISTLVAVQVWANGRRLGTAQIGRPRDDVREQFSEYPNAAESGFLYVGRVPEEEVQTLRTVKVEAIAIGGISRSVVTRVQSGSAATSELTPELLTLQADNLRLTIDGALMAQGWIVADSGVEGVSLLLDGKQLGEFVPALPRPDVAALYPHIPSAARAGFQVEAATRRKMKGEHLLSFQVRTVSGFSQRFDFQVKAGGYAAATAETAPAAAGSEIMMNLDSPKVLNGVMGDKINDFLTLGGWCVADSGVEKVEVEIDGRLIGKAYYGIQRHDIEAAFPERKNALLSGFGLTIPASALEDGRHQFSIVATAKSGARSNISFAADVEKVELETRPSILRRKMPYPEVQTALRVLANVGYEPSFHLLLETRHSGECVRDLAATLGSLRDQKWTRWHLTIFVPPGNSRERVARLLRDQFADVESKTELRVASAAAPIAGSKTKGSGDTDRLVQELLSIVPDDDKPRLICRLVAGDELGADALLELALGNAVGEAADLLYSDDRRNDPVSGRVQAFFKPDWSPDLLLSTNYIGRAWAADPALLRKVAEAGKGTGSEYDFVLRLSERANSIRHIQKTLFSAPVQSEGAPEMRSALKGALARRGEKAKVMEGCATGIFRVQRDVAKEGLVSIIIPSIAAHGHIEKCLKSIRDLSTYRQFEIIVIDNIHGGDLTDGQIGWKQWFRDHADIALPVDEPFNWSRFNNIGARSAKGEYLLFLNDDIEILDPDWLQALIEHAQRPEVGVVGPQLLYPDRKVQHAGLFLSGPGLARHAFRFSAEDEPGYFGLALTQRNMIAVTGACMLVRRESYEASGGFEEAHAVINNDLDYCLRAHAKGQLVVYTPHTKLIHHELASRAKMKGVYDTSAFAEQWRDIFTRGDPFFSPHLSTSQDSYGFDPETLREVWTGNPIAAAAEVKRILAVKLDHIGDFLTAFPAIERLRQAFPQATLSLLVGRSARGMADYVPGIEEIFDFEYFHARSGLGNVEVSEEDLFALGERLKPRRFDLAVDLRKHDDTRHVLQYTGAKYLAGFDNKAAFPWLDVAIARQEDIHYAPKRQHVGDDLINLIDAVGAAFDLGNAGRAMSDDERPEIPLALAGAFPVLAGGYICLHPAAGNVLRQWPPERFAALADMLIEAEGVPVVIIGGPDEAEIAQKVIGKMRHLHKVTSLVGQTKLSEVPAVIAQSLLFIGNNSGPSHIAAWLGTPTVAVHSAVVPSEEWGPRGRDAVAIRRDTVCSPCYRSKPEDCHRGLACLTSLPVGTIFDACRRLLKIRRPAAIGSRRAA